MSYTPPAGDAINGDWIGAATYTPPAGDAISGDWIEAVPDAVAIRVAVESPLGVVAVLAAHPYVAFVDVASPLGAPAALIRHANSVHLDIPSPLLAPGPEFVVWHDFTGLLGDVISHYVMDLDTPSGAVRVPISSWQATLQAGLSSYVQCVIPAATNYTAAIESATAFTVRRRAVAPSGLAVEYPMATAPAQTVRFDRGPQRNTCTLSGYTPASAPIGEAPPPALYDRELVGVRSISSGAGGVRVRCAIDWTLRPGHRAFVEGAPFVVSYINYYVTGGDAYADVGERA